MNAPARILERQTAQARPVPALMPSLERRRLQCYIALMLGDIAAIFGGFALGGYLYLGAAEIGRAILFAQMILPVFLTIALYNGAYSTAALQRAGRGMFRAGVALAVAIAVVQFIAFYARANQEFSRVAVALGAVAAFLALGWMRMQMRGFIRWRCGASVTNLLVIDDDGPDVDLQGTCRISARAFNLVPRLDDPHALDRIGMALRHADRVVISCPPERRAAWALILKGANVAGDVIDPTVAELGARGARTEGGQGWLEVSAGPLGLRDRVTKRLFDIVATSLILILLSPVLALVALAILLEDGAPVLFVQRRVGRGNRFFAIYKFRSMRNERSDADGRTSASRDDDRITRVGRFIRATSIDELPQLFNVLAGDMSLVGPRPHAIGSQAGDKLFWEVDQRYWLRHALKPGITGLAQVRGWRGATECETDLKGRLQADLEYLRGWSLWRDIRILVATVKVLVHERAY